MLLKGKEEKAKGVAIVIINAGVWARLLEFVSPALSTSNRIRQIAAGELVCNYTSRPADWRGVGAGGQGESQTGEMI